MFKKIREKIADFIAPDYIDKLEKLGWERDGEVTKLINQRVAQTLLDMDPFEPLLKQFHGVFSQEFEHPEENLDAKSQLSMKMWGYQQIKDPNFQHMINWIMNTQGNETLKRAPVTTDRILYGRAQLSNMILFKKEVGRLASLYEELLEKNKGLDFDDEKSVE